MLTSIVYVELLKVVCSERQIERFGYLQYVIVPLYAIEKLKMVWK